MEITSEISLRAEEIEKIIYGYLPKEEGYQKTVLQAMNYSVKAGGKRLRPMLMEETYRMFGGTSPAIEPFMAALEMIHTYSLVHDDLPAMDNDMLRRGLPTTHAKYGEAMAILAGDALLNYAFETAMKALTLDFSPKVRDALLCLGQKAGIYGMIGGQVVDVEAEKKQQTISKEQLDFIYRLKTGALIEAAMMIGAILSDATKEQIAVMEQVAAKVGMAFQIQDDILDVTGDTSILGKPVGSDEKNEKSTYVVFMGLEEAKAEVERLSKEAVALLNSMSVENPFLTELLLYLIHRNK